MNKEIKKSEERSKDKVVAKLAQIQLELKVAKGQKNSFGNYKYRTGSDILEGVKPLLDGATVTMSDKINYVGDRYYLEATAMLTFEGQSITKTALARETEEKKGMDAAQITGSASSYARKYALSGLFAIDDSTSDPDSKNNCDTRISSKQIALIEVNFKTLGTDESGIIRGVSKVSEGRASKILELFSSEAESLLIFQNKRIKEEREVA